MKNIKLLTILTISLALGMVSCNKEGDIGPAGPAGANGNANAKTIILENLDWNGGSSMNITVPQLTSKNIAEDAILEYAYFSSAVYNIPGPAYNGNFLLRTYFNSGSTVYKVKAVDWDGTTYASPDSIHQIKLVIIESTTPEIVHEVLTDAGVNPNDYKAVKEFYGIIED